MSAVIDLLIEELKEVVQALDRSDRGGVGIAEEVDERIARAFEYLAENLSNPRQRLPIGSFDGSTQTVRGERPLIAWRQFVSARLGNAVERRAAQHYIDTRWQGDAERAAYYLHLIAEESVS